MKTMGEIKLLKTYDYDNSINKYFSYYSYVEDNKITLDRSDATYYFSETGCPPPIRKTIEYRAISFISCERALWLVKVHKTNS